MLEKDEGCSKSNASYLFSRKLQQRAQLHYFIEQILSYKTLFFNVIITLSYVFLPTMNKILYAVLVKICTSGDDLQSLSSVLKGTTHCLTVLTSTVWSPSVFNKCQWVPFFLNGGIQWHTFASWAPPCQMPLCQTAPLLPSVTQQQNVTGILVGRFGLCCLFHQHLPLDVMGQQNKIGGITFRMTYIFQKSETANDANEYLYFFP